MHETEVMFKLSLFSSKSDNKPNLVVRAWKDLNTLFANPDVRSNKDGLLFSPATFEPPLRRKENVRELSLLMLDLDHHTTLERLKKSLQPLNCSFAIYSTHSHLRVTSNNPDAEPRYRVVIPLALPITAALFPALWQWASDIEGISPDEQAKDASRMYYAPSKACSDAPYEFHIEYGLFLDWRELNLRASGKSDIQSTIHLETSSFEFHEDRHAELCRRIMARGQLNSRGNYDAQCLAHNGKGNTAVAFFPDNGAVTCNAGCSYDRLLEAEDLSAGHLPSSKKRLEGGTQSDIEIGTVAEWPNLHPLALHGIAGDFVRLVSPHSEADPIALLAQFLVAFGNLIGRCAHFTAEADKHFTNIFLVLVGATGAGRKGTSWGQVKFAFDGLDEVWQKDCHAGGMSSGEGLIYHVRDIQTKQKPVRTNGISTGIKEIEVVDEGVSDKRLLVFEGEFASVLRAQGREGNTLSMVIRNLWDTGDARSLVKNSPIRTTNAHVSIIGHITKDELRSCLDEVESVNGYVNRFLWLCVKRDKFLSRGGSLSEADFAPIKRALRQALEFAVKISTMDLDDEAWELWDIAYMRLETGRTGLLGKVTQRAAPYVRRLACLYALLNCSAIVRLEHLKAALAFWQYAEDSARYIFGGRTGDRIADDVLRALNQAGNDGLTQTAISDLFGRNRSKAAIDRALHLLLESGLVRHSKERTEGRGRPTVRWFTILHSYEKNEINRFSRNYFVSFVPSKSKDLIPAKAFDYNCSQDREVFEV